MTQVAFSWSSTRVTVRRSRAFAGVLCLVLAAWPAVASPCGAWTLQDHGLGARIDFSGVRVRVTRGKTRDREILWGNQHAPPSAFVVRGLERRVVDVPETLPILFDVRGSTLRHHGENVGELYEGGVRIGASEFAISMRDLDASERKRRNLRHELAWATEIRRDGELLVNGDAAMVCGDEGAPDGPTAREITRRWIVYYLAWRQLSGSPLARPSEPPTLRAGVAEAVARGTDDWRACFDEILADYCAGASSPKAVLSWHVGADGGARNIKQVEGNPAFSACLIPKMKEWRFPKSQGDHYEVTYPFLCKCTCP